MQPNEGSAKKLGAVWDNVLEGGSPSRDRAPTYRPLRQHQHCSGALL